MKNHLVCHNKSNDAIAIFTVNKNPKIDCNFWLTIEIQTLHLPLIVLGIFVYPDCSGALKTLAPKPRLQINRWFQTVSLFPDFFRCANSNHPFASLSQTRTIIRTAQACATIINFPVAQIPQFLSLWSGAFVFVFPHLRTFSHQDRFRNLPRLRRSVRFLLSTLQNGTVAPRMLAGC